MGLLADRGVSDVGFVGRQGSGVFGGEDDPVLLWRVGHPRQPGVEGDRRLQRQLARNVAELAHPGDLPADRLQQLFALVVGVGDGVELLGLGDGGGGDVGGRLRSGLGGLADSADSAAIAFAPPAAALSPEAAGASPRSGWQASVPAASAAEPARKSLRVVVARLRGDPKSPYRRASRLVNGLR